MLSMDVQDQINRPITGYGYQPVAMPFLTKNQSVDPINDNENDMETPVMQALYDALHARAPAGLFRTWFLSLLPTGSDPSSATGMPIQLDSQ